MNVSRQSNLFLIRMSFLVRFLLSAIFIISAIGKLLDSNFAAQIIAQLFKLPLFVSQIMVVLLIVLELIIAVSVWKQQIPKIFITVPFLLLMATLFSYWHDLNCGCFGSLPFLSQMSLGAHLLLLGGIFLGILYLINYTSLRSEQGPEKLIVRYQSHQRPALFNAMGVIALAMLLISFLALPFSAQNNNVHNSPTNYQVVDRSFVEKAISNDNILIIDARPEFQYELSHIPKSLNIPYNSDRLDSTIQQYALNEKLLILYCSDSHCNAAEILAQRLSHSGCPKIAIYQGGWEDWIRYEKKTNNQAAYR